MSWLRRQRWICCPPWAAQARDLVRDIRTIVVVARRPPRCCGDRSSADAVLGEREFKSHILRRHLSGAGLAKAARRESTTSTKHDSCERSHNGRSGIESGRRESNPHHQLGRLSRKSPSFIAITDLSTRKKPHVRCLVRCFVAGSRRAREPREHVRRAASARDGGGTCETQVQGLALFKGTAASLNKARRIQGSPEAVHRHGRREGAKPLERSSPRG